MISAHIASLLNDPAVRVALAGRGIVLTRNTCFVAALHDTATDVVTLFDTDLLPESHGPDLQTLQG